MEDPTWVYHPEKAAKIIPGAEVESHLKKGWYESPADFALAEMGEEKEEEAEKIALNFGMMTRKELATFALNNFGVHINTLEKHKTLVTQVEKLFYDDSPKDN